MTNDAFLLAEECLLDPPPNALMAGDEFCPRQITFTMPGKVGVQVTATKRDGQINFVVDVLGSAKEIAADLRGRFIHHDKSKLGNLQITGGDGLITETRQRPMASSTSPRRQYAPQAGAGAGVT